MSLARVRRGVPIIVERESYYRGVNRFYPREARTQFRDSLCRRHDGKRDRVYDRQYSDNVEYHQYILSLRSAESSFKVISRDELDRHFS